MRVNEFDQLGWEEVEMGTREGEFWEQQDHWEILRWEKSQRILNFILFDIAIKFATINSDPWICYKKLFCPLEIRVVHPCFRATLAVMLSSSPSF